jgi:diadenosine tetraphosphate (Ap4A) HIT family hydrolase
MANELACAFSDAFPVSRGHALIIPRRHESDFFRLAEAEHSAIMELVRQMKVSLQERHHPDAYNIGVNAGAAAGQTVAHAHVHLIPRYKGDAEDPRGGVRWVLPKHAAYWHKPGSKGALDMGRP